MDGVVKPSGSESMHTTCIMFSKASARELAFVFTEGHDAVSVQYHMYNGWES